LAKRVRKSLKITFEKIRYFTDPSAVLGMLKTEFGRFNEFVVAHVSEIKFNSHVETEWFWLTGDCFPVNVGTRTATTPGDARCRCGIPNWHKLDEEARF
jgi:hypothetical protein